MECHFDNALFKLFAHPRKFKVNDGRNYFPERFPESTVKSFDKDVRRIFLSLDASKCSSVYAAEYLRDKLDDFVLHLVQCKIFAAPKDTIAGRVQRSRCVLLLACAMSHGGMIPRSLLLGTAGAYKCRGLSERARVQLELAFLNMGGSRYESGKARS